MKLLSIKNVSKIFLSFHPSSKWYAKRLAVEQGPSKCLSLHADAQQSSAEEVTKDKAKKGATEAERMFKNVELFIQQGMKLKNFSDIVSGQAVLAQARPKVARSIFHFDAANKGNKA